MHGIIHITSERVLTICRLEPSKQARPSKRKLQDGEAGETYKAQYEWGYVPMKRRRAASPSGSSGPPCGISSSHHPTQSVDSTQLELPATPVSQLVQSRLQGTPTVTPAARQPECLGSALLQSQPQHVSYPQHQRDPASSVSPLPASSSSDVTTLYCNEELIDTMDTTAGTPHSQPPLMQQQLSGLPATPRPSSASCNPAASAVHPVEQLVSRQQASHSPAKLNTEQSPLELVQLAADTPASSQLGSNVNQPSTAYPLQHQVSGRAVECAHILSGTWDDGMDIPDSATPDAAGSPRADALATVGAEVPRSKPAAGGPQCGFCLTRDTPQWRDGPGGTRTACNACSTAWQRAGRPMGPWLPGRVARMRTAQAATTAAAAAV